MLNEKAVMHNWTLVESYNQEIQEGDIIQIKLFDWTMFNETIILQFHQPRLVLFHKPIWYVVSKEDRHNKTIYELLPASWKKDFWYIWRLDKNSSWLLLLTNKPDVVDRYENPKNDIHKVYQVAIDKPFRTKHVKKTQQWIELTEQGEQPKKWDYFELLSFVSVHYQRDRSWKFRLTITLNEWKKRHIRRVLKFLWYKIYSLHRIKVWKRLLWDIKPGKRKMEKKLY